MSHFNQEPRFLKVFAGVLLLLVFALISGCDILPAETTLTPTTTSTQTGTPTPTIEWFPATPTTTLQIESSPTPQSTQTGQRQGVTELLMDDNFTDQSLWETYQSNSGNVAYGIQNLSIAVAQRGASLSSVSQHTLPANFYLEVTIQTALSQPSDQIGVIFWRQSSGDYYRLLLDSAGEYRLDVAQGGQNIVVHNWETASQMELGTQAENRLGLYVKEGQFQFYINDVFQFTEQIARDRNGRLAFFARTINGSAMTIRFTDLQIFQVETE